MPRNGTSAPLQKLKGQQVNSSESLICPLIFGTKPSPSMSILTLNGGTFYWWHWKTASNRLGLR